MKTLHLPFSLARAQGHESPQTKAHPSAVALPLVLLAGLMPLIVSGFTLSLLALWLPLVILAISLDFLWGENHVISFGHGAFFAGGGYVAGLLLKGPQSNSTAANYAILGTSGSETHSAFQSLVHTLAAPQLAGVPILALILPPLLCGIVGALVGAVIFNIGSVEIYAPLVTLGVGVIAATVFLQLSALGGSNGLSSIPAFTREIASGSQRSIYYFNAAWLVLVYLGYAAFRRSRAGRRWRASGDDPIRLQALGVGVHRLRATGFAASTALAGLAGALYVGASGFMSTQTAGVLFSVQALIWVAVGGPGSLWAPLVGVLAIQFGQQELSERLQDSWQLLLGAVLILVVLVAPGGLTGLAASLARLARPRSRQPVEREPVQPEAIQSESIREPVEREPIQSEGAMP
ncbi:MAG TPA: branched-chain amino acid ABC transporter permease [Solirubrobacteraceae bacterium]|jgi:urea transport system permease protein|nr:branched-chain amino acid ABC transporter permease [Solirubrobacteraceae bacterium]